MARKKITPEEKAEQDRLFAIENEKANIRRAIKDIQIQKDNGLLNPPTRLFAVGESVEYGAFSSSVVEEILFDGYAYILQATKVYDGQFETRKPTEKLTRIVVWHDVFPDRRSVDKSSIKKLSQKFDFGHAYNTTIDSLLHQYYYFGIDMDPVYQREHVWSLEDKVALIDSIMSDVEIGRFVIMVRPYDTDTKKMYEIIDGKQRLTALIEFYEDRFEYKGKKYSELHPADQNHFDEKSVLKIEPAYMSLEDRINYFIRINTTGKVMDKSHLDKVQDMLKKFNAD